MREILFRGISEVTKEWVYGYLVKTQIKGKEYFTIVPYEDLMKTLIEKRWFQVIPETVGQYTGLTDKNGKKIFEGDIVRKPELYMNAVGVIRYGGTHFRCSCKEYPDLGIWTLDEVIGNIHDNPELLKGE